MERYYFLEEDYKALLAKINELENRIKKFDLEFGEFRNQVASSETADLCNAKASIGAIEVTRKKLKDLLNRAEKVKPKDKFDAVYLGAVVNYLDLGSNRTFCVQIGSFENFAQGDIKKSSYTSPLSKILLGAKPGDVREGVLGDRSVELEILSIH